MPHYFVRVALDVPLDKFFDYRLHLGADQVVPPSVGQLALVPFGKQKIVSLIVGVNTETDLPEEKIRPVIAIRDQLAPLPETWLAMSHFAAGYYQRPLGEVALPALPKMLRTAGTVALDRALKKLAAPPATPSVEPGTPPNLNAAQQEAVNAIVAAQDFSPFLLHGITGSGENGSVSARRRANSCAR